MIEKGLQAVTKSVGNGIEIIERAAFIEVGYNYLAACRDGRRDKRQRHAFANVLREDIQKQGFVIAKDHDFMGTVAKVLDKIAADFDLPAEPDEMRP